LRACTGDRRQRTLRRQTAEHAIDQRAGSRGIDVTYDGDLEVVAGEYLPYEGPEILGRNGWDRFQGAARRTRVGVAREGGCPPALAGEFVRARGRSSQPRQTLLAYALHILGVETGRRQRQLEQVERLILVLGQRAQRPGHIVASRRKADLDRHGFEPFVEAL
jgi:hypothetical protein